MEIKQWRNLGLALAVLVVIYLLTQVGETRFTADVDAVFDIKEDAVGRIVMAVDQQTATLVRGDTLWVMQGYEERQLRQWHINNFFSSVLGVKRESMISENPAKWLTYGVDDSTGKRLEVYNLAGELVSKVVVGQSRSNYQSSYVRFEGRNEVYLTDQNIHRFLSTDTTFWLEPLPEPEEEADAVEPLPSD